MFVIKTLLVVNQEIPISSIISRYRQKNWKQTNYVHRMKGGND